MGRDLKPRDLDFTEKGKVMLISAGRSVPGLKEPRHTEAQNRSRSALVREHPR